jgi:hypothetical protein
VISEGIPVKVLAERDGLSSKEHCKISFQFQIEQKHLQSLKTVCDRVIGANMISTVKRLASSKLNLSAAICF